MSEHHDHPEPAHKNQQHIFSRSLNIRTTITKLTNKKSPHDSSELGGDLEGVTIYEIISYQWNEKDTDEEGSPLWERIADPITCDDLDQAEAEAKKQCQTFAGEIPDENIPETLTEIVEKNFGKNFEFLKPINFTYQNSEEKNQSPPERLLAIDEFFLLEYPGYWNIGILLEDNRIQSWKQFENIKEALQTIKKLQEIED